MFLLVTFGKKIDFMWDSIDFVMNQWIWMINYDATKVKSVDKKCPLIKFVGQHRVSYLGHKRPKMLKNSEWQACMVDTILGQCVTFNPLRVPLSTLPSPGSCGCHFQPRCHTWGGLSMKYLYCQHRVGQYILECCEKYKSFKLKIPQPDSEQRHSPDFRTIFGIMIGPFSSCEIGKTWGTNKQVNKQTNQNWKLQFP